jgi:hypothetical protein
MLGSFSGGFTDFWFHKVRIRNVTACLCQGKLSLQSRFLLDIKPLLLYCFSLLTACTTKRHPLRTVTAPLPLQDATAMNPEIMGDFASTRAAAPTAAVVKPPHGKPCAQP